MCSQMVSPFTVDAAQIGKRPRGTPLVPGFSKGQKRALIQFPGGDHVALRSCYVSLLVDRPGGTIAIAKFSENVRCFLERPLSARIVAASFDHIGKVVKTAGDCRPVRQQTPASKTSLKIALRRGVVTPIPLEHSNTQRCPIDRPILHKETGSVAENSRPPDSRPEPSLRLRENATLLPVLLSVHRQPCAE